MKKVLSVIVMLLLIITAGCTTPQTDSDNQSKPMITKTVYTKGVWFSFSELNTMLAEGQFKDRFESAIGLCQTLGITDVYIHVRAYCDALYPSKYFPLISAAAGYDYDLLEYIVQTCHLKNIRVHAWLNPYRVRTADENFAALPDNNPAKIWHSDGNTDNDINICYASGIFMNPASPEVRGLVINGIREILEKYAVDGIHFDDYFYPTTDPSFDKTTYVNYVASSETPLPLDDWRRANVNALISGAYTAIKYIRRNVEFSISPAASIENNYTHLYADVKAWAREGCIDTIIPQLYFGYEYPQADFKFDRLLKVWSKAFKSYDVHLKIGLAPYKVGTTQIPDAAEWGSCDDLLSRQVSDCKENSAVDGYVFFSYTSLFGTNPLQIAERENLMQGE